MYDTTVFVQATINEVMHTLIEAFVLVVIVVFLFLGILRATLIPIIAVPVALIGTFAVLLALGFTANTVSLLALVLAIGIVVDDAIVVVEAVERVMEHEPGLPPKRGDREGDGPDHRADHRHHPGAAVGVHPDRLHPRHLRPALPAVRVAVSVVDGDLGDQRALALAGAVRADPAPPQEADRNHGVDAGRHRPDARRLHQGRDAAGAARHRGAPAGRAGFAAATGGIGSMVPSGFLPEEDQGLPSWPRCSCPSAPRPTARSRPSRKSRRPSAAKPWKQSVFTVVGYSLIDGWPCRTAPFFVVELKPFDQRKDPSLSVFQALKELNRRQRQIAGGQRLRLQPAADHGPRQFVGLRVRGSVARRRLADRSRGGGARGDDIGAGSAGTRRRLHDLQRVDAADQPRARPRASAALGISISDIFSAMQTSLGGAYYVNDFNLFGRTWQVKVQADASTATR
jgi:multidrug efflux pump subunit AcrB